MEMREEKPGFAKIHQVPNHSAHKIQEIAHQALGEEVVVGTDGLRVYCVLSNNQRIHEPIVVGDGTNQMNSLPRIFMLIGNI